MNYSNFDLIVFKAFEYRGVNISNNIININIILITSAKQSQDINNYIIIVNRFQCLFNIQLTESSNVTIR